jgi:broad specificity phosphatase PhoE
LVGEPISAVYTSDLGRAHQTAQSIAEVTGTPVVAEEGLRERSFGLFEGKTFTEIHETWPDHAQNWRKRLPDWAPPEGGESLLQLRERVTRTVQLLASREDEAWRNERRAELLGATAADFAAFGAALQCMAERVVVLGGAEALDRVEGERRGWLSRTRLT